MESERDGQRRIAHGADAQSIGPDAILPRLETQAKKTPTDNGLTAEKIAGAKLQTKALPRSRTFRG